MSTVLIALSAPPGPNPGGDLVNATPDDTSERQLWELVVSLLLHPECDDGLRVAMRNKYTGFVAAAPVGDNTLGVTEEGFDLSNPGLLWTFAPAGGLGWAIRPAGRQNQNLSANAKIDGEVGIWAGEPVPVWSAVYAPQ